MQSCSQDSTAVVVMLQHLLRTLKDEHPEIMRANLRQDNASCYHSSNTILAMAHLKQSIGINIVRVDFSDPQGEKGAADRLAATCKSHIRIYINEGHNVTNAQEMKTALTSCGGIEGVRVAVVEGIDKLPMQDYQKIVGINKLNNFQYTKDCIIGWRAYDIAQGKEIPVEKVSDIGRVSLKREVWHKRNSNGEAVGSRTQFPVMLCYATTCHKSQGFDIASRCGALHEGIRVWFDLCGIHSCQNA
ncbi:hypothetical protein QZH41_001122 [Actinostola sp. cb2023]|nr:hypothetical protein QZH41_001122 [Actinostola sp. cb2023]